MRHRIPIAVTALFVALGAAPALGAGTITTVAGPGVRGTSGDGGPATQAYIGADVGVTALPDGSYLIAHQDSPAVRRVFPDGTITTIAGNGTAGYSGDGGPATAATLNGVSAAIPAPSGGYLIADPNNNAVRRVAPDGTISTVAGQPPGSGFGGDGGPATSAQLSFPFDVSFLPDGSFLIADKDNARIRRVGTDGVISTVAGGGGALGDSGPATSAQLAEPSGVTAYGNGGYLIADSTAQRIRYVEPNGTIHTIAGTGTAGDTGDGGPATSAQINRPVRTVVQPDGGFLIVEQNGARVRHVASDGTISTIAGTGSAGFGGDGGPATAAQLNTPFGAAVLPSGDILIADGSNGRIRFVDVDTPAPRLTVTNPVGPDNDNNPHVMGTAPAGTTVALFTTADCSGDPVAQGTAADLGGSGIAVQVPDNSVSNFYGVTIDAAGNRSACSAGVVYDEVTPIQQPGPEPLPAPVIGKKINAVPEKGTVLVKLPGGRFVPLETLGRQVPVGATLDTTHGTVALTTAGLKKGSKQVGHFSRGVFKVGQPKKSPLTTLTMVGGGLAGCKAKLPKGGAPKPVSDARKRRRTLFSSVKGRFRTRGRNSTATVRGTAWSMTDTCAGTLTKVTRGAVLVRDLTLRHNVLVKKGRSYLARAPGRKKKLRR